MRWLLVPLGLALVAAAAWLLLAAPDGEPEVAPAVSAPPASRPAPASPPAAPMGDIDDASRRALERVLEREGIDP